MATVVASQGVHLSTDSVHSTSTQSTLSQSNLYRLDVRQQPRQARLASLGGEKSVERRTVDPPPIIRLRFLRPSAGRKPSHLLNDDDFTSPTLTHRHFMWASLVPENSEEEMYELAGKNKLVAGNVVSSLFHLRDQSCFVFPDLSVRTEGRWRFKMSMYEIVEDGFIFCDSVLTDVFQVYNAKRSSGMSKSQELSQSFAPQGLKLRIRKPGARDAEEVEDRQTALPPRKKSKPTPRSRPSHSVASWPTTSRSHHSTPVVNRRTSGPPDLSHDLPLVAPAGCTSVPQQKRPWTSWNASPPSKIAPPYPSSNGYSSHESYSHSARAGVIRSFSQDFRRLPQLDERDTEPVASYSRPSSSHHQYQSHEMPPPPSRHSPPNPSNSATFPTPIETSSRIPRYPSPPTVLAPIRSNLPQPINRTPSLEWSDPFRRSESSKSSTETAEPDEGIRRGIEEKQTKKRSKGSGGSLAMLLGEGGGDPKEAADISFF